MKNKQRFSLLTATALFFLAMPLLAHHGEAAYDTSKETVVMGKVTEFQFVNPHAHIYFEVQATNGKIEKWMGQASSPNMLSRQGWSNDTLKPGDEITVSGHRAKTDSHTLLLDKLVLSNGRELSPQLRLLN